MRSGLRLIRHPLTAAPKGLCYGRSCPGLAPGWEAAADSALRRLSGVTRIVSSPSPRCLTLAEHLAAALGAALETDARLRELDFGRWEGLLWSEIDRAESDPWAEDPVRRAPPGGESFGALAARVTEAAAALEAEVPETTLAVTHAGPIRALWMRARGLSFEAAFARPVPYARPVFPHAD